MNGTRCRATARPERRPAAIPGDQLPRLGFLRGLGRHRRSGPFHSSVLGPGGSSAADEYDPLAEPVSALEAGPNGWIQQINFVVFGLLTIAFAVGLHRGLRPIRAGIAGPALLFLSGIGLLLAAAFPLSEDAAGVTIRPPAGHIVAGTTFFLSSALGLIVVSRRLARDPALAEHLHLHARGRDRCVGGLRSRRRPGGAGRRSATRLGRLVPAVDRPCHCLSLPHRSLAQVAAGCDRAAVIPGIEKKKTASVRWSGTRVWSYRARRNSIDITTYGPAEISSVATSGGITLSIRSTKTSVLLASRTICQRQPSPYSSRR